MAEFNTVCLSGVLRGKVEVYKKQGLQVARFFIDVEGAGDGRSHPRRPDPRGVAALEIFQWQRAIATGSPGSNTTRTPLEGCPIPPVIRLQRP